MPVGVVMSEAVILRGTKADLTLQAMSRLGMDAYGINGTQTVHRAGIRNIGLTGSL